MGLAEAATWQVGPTRVLTTINGGIAAAAPGDTVEVDPGTYAEAVVVDRQITLVGLGGADVTIIAPTAGAAIDVSFVNATVRGFTVTGGDPGIHVTTGSFTGSELIVAGNHGTGDGGGLRAEGGTSAVITDSVFDDNSAVGFRGGHVYADGGLTRFTRVSFTAGLADEGGGWHVAGGLVVGVDCVVDGNVADVGGGIHVGPNAQVSLTRTVLAGNEGLDAGGGLVLSATSPADSAFAILFDTELDANLAPFGAAGWIRYGVVQSNATFVHDHGEGIPTGGILVDTAGQWSGVGDVFSDNHGGAGAGGGLYLTDDGSADLSELTATGNSATSGGFLYSESTSGFSVADGVFTDNAATAEGGAIAMTSGAVLLGLTRFTGNTAGTGGAVALRDATVFQLLQSSFGCNTAGSGGAVLTDGVGTFAPPVVSSVVFTGNRATAGDGAAWRVQTTAGALVLEHLTVVGHDGGAAIHVDAGTVRLSHGVLSQNAGGGFGSVAGSWIAPQYVLWWANTPDLVGGFVGEAFGPDDRFVDPFLVRWTDDGDCTNDDLRPRFGSPVVNAGDPGRVDPDGSRVDLGAYGGDWAPAELFVDGDQDGFIALLECDDARDVVHPFAVERCNDSDDNCDGLIDPPESVDAFQWLADADADGFGAPGTMVSSCFGVIGHVLLGPVLDCDDTTANRRPGLAETCDGVDNDCDALVDEGVQTTFFADGDDDGVGSGAGTAACAAPAGFVATSGDCDDGDAARRPGLAEVCDGVDNDCDALVDEGVLGLWYPDRDGDGVGGVGPVGACVRPTGFVSASGDCDDLDPQVWPGATELCDGIDNDCDGERDEGVRIARTFYEDRDGDGFGVAGAATATGCVAPPGFAVRVGDCDDADSAVYPGAVERCDGRDGDCDGTVDGGAVDATAWYRDDDGDGWGTDAVRACVAPDGFAAGGDDCDDGDPDVHPGAVEDCDDGVDRNCDGSVGRADADADGTVACEDCDDRLPSVHPGADERCNGRDDDCDGDVDGGAVDARTWYRDDDGDGYGGVEARVSCFGEVGFVAVGGDCDEADPDVHPGAAEVWYDGFDQDCDGWSDFDADRDGYDALDAGGEDCDDTTSVVNPGVEEPSKSDGVDQDCDGVDGEVIGCGCVRSGTSGTYAVLWLPLALWWRRRT